MPSISTHQAVNQILAELGIQSASPGQRKRLAEIVEAETGLAQLEESATLAIGRIEQVEKHLDMNLGPGIKLWKRIFIDEMLLHARSAREVLPEALGERRGGRS